MAEENRPQTVADVRKMLNEQNAGKAPVDSTPNPKFQEAIQGTTQDQQTVDASLTPTAPTATVQDTSTQDAPTEQAEPAQDEGDTDASKRRTSKGK